MDDMNLRAEARWIIMGATVVSVVFIVCLTVLAMEGKSSEDLSRLLNTGLNVVGVLLGGGALWRVGTAAREASGARQEARTAAEQTNGALDARMAAAVHRVLNEREERA